MRDIEINRHHSGVGFDPEKRATPMKLGGHFNRGICDCRNSLKIRRKCSKEDSNLHRFPY
jgi:hypothetical protein